MPITTIIRNHLLFDGFASVITRITTHSRSSALPAVQLMKQDFKDILNARFAAITEAQDLENHLSSKLVVDGGGSARSYISGFTDAFLNDGEKSTYHDLIKQKRELEKEHKKQSFQLKVLRSVEDWISGTDWPIFQKPGESLFHKAIAPGGIVYGKDEELEFVDAHADAAQIFLMQHDWASMLRGTEAEEGEFQLPADPIAFEFQVSGRRYITLCKGSDVVEIAQTPYGWAITAMPGDLLQRDHFTCQQIRAMCILLEAEVLESEIVRAPHRLNRQRERRGKLPILDHHVLKLTTRRCYSPFESEEGDKRQSPRMHFRRGHWRHHRGHKTWIRWQLVGDSDLGFIDKVYAA